MTNEQQQQTTTTPAAAATSERLQSQRRARGTAWNVAFLISMFAISLAALVLWTRLPMGSVWIGVAAIVVVLIVGALGMTLKSRGRPHAAPR